jgi:UDP-glucose 4-epimerase
MGSPIRFVIHFAALKAVGESVKKPLLYFRNNVTGTVNLFECMEEFGCFNLIFSSSATVYKPGEYVGEEESFQPSNPYGETKIAVEYLIRSMARSSN